MSGTRRGLISGVAAAAVAAALPATARAVPDDITQDEIDEALKNQAWGMYFAMERATTTGLQWFDVPVNLDDEMLEFPEYPMTWHLLGASGVTRWHPTGYPGHSQEFFDSVGTVENTHPHEAWLNYMNTINPWGSDNWEELRKWRAANGVSYFVRVYYTEIVPK